MKTLTAIFFASTYGFALRLCFLMWGSVMEVISLSLIVLAPLAIGFLTVTLSGPERIKDGLAAFFRPWAVTAILTLLTIILSIEGAICWIIIYPFFSIMAGIGGLIGYWWMLRRYINHKQGSDSDDILDDLNGLQLSPFLVLPLFFGLIENDHFLSTEKIAVQRQITINAAPQQVWTALVTIDSVPAHIERGFWEATAFDLPRHLRTEVDSFAVGGRRTAYYEKGVYFEETILAWEPQSRLHVRIKANPGSIPPHVLDDHVVIGGKHFKALEDIYQIRPTPDGRCELTLTGEVEICTPFNWYTAIWADVLMSDAFDSLLKTIEYRATRQ
jgi:hypothetical protein